MNSAHITVERRDCDHENGVGTQHQVDVVTVLIKIMEMCWSVDQNHGNGCNTPNVILVPASPAYISSISTLLLWPSIVLFYCVLCWMPGLFQKFLLCPHPTLKRSYRQKHKN